MANAAEIFRGRRIFVRSVAAFGPPESGFVHQVWFRPYGTDGDDSRYAWPIPVRRLHRNVTLAICVESTFPAP